MNQDAPLGSFEEHVLLAALRLGASAYGMQVRREIESCTGRRVAIGAVYATLDRLEAKGLTRSQSHEVDGRSRRVFAVSSPGIEALKRSRKMRQALWSGIDLTADALS